MKSSSSSRRPNIVFFLPDQLRSDFLGCYGAQFLKTPNIDSIAAHGHRYARAVSSSPECVPARTALMTGMHPIRNSVTNNDHALRPDHRDQGIETWPQLLSDAGYSTCAVGKMHFYPWDRRGGFQRRVIAEDKRHTQIRDDYYHYLRRHGLRKLPPREIPGFAEGHGATFSPIPFEHSADAFCAREAARFIRESDTEQPFALMVGFPGPHDPYDPDPRMVEGVDPARIPASIPQVPGDNDGPRELTINGHRGPALGLDFTDFSEEIKHRLRYHYAGLVQQIDHCVGTVLAAIQEAGQADNTVVVFSSDHGDYLGDHNLASKSSHFESAIRIPLIAHLPGQTEPVVHDELVDLYDLAPTILALAEVPAPAVMDAIPIPGLVPDARPRTQILGALNRSWMLLNDRYKITRYFSGELVVFDLHNDPQEQRNLARDPDQVQLVRRLDAALTTELMAMQVKEREHTRVITSAGPHGVGEYNREGWHRTYPHPVLPGADRITLAGPGARWTFSQSTADADSAPADDRPTTGSGQEH